MKKLLKNTKKFSLVLALLLSGGLLAKPVVLVSSIKGNVFSVTNGKARELRVGDYVDDFSSIMTEEGAQITFSDFYDHKFHLAGSGMVKLLNRMLELKRGYLWVQSLIEGDEFKLQSANAVVTFKYGDGIFSFDNLSGKSQMMVIKGRFRIQNILHEDMGELLDESSFSFVDNDYDRGIPRKATRVGNQSFLKVKGLFSGILSEGVEKGSILPIKYDARKKEPKQFKATRLPASVSASGKGSGGVTYYRALPKRQKLNLDEFYQEKIDIIEKNKRKKKKFVPSYAQKSGVPLRFFGTKRKRGRKIASIPKRREAAKVVKPTQRFKNDRTTRKPASMMEVNPQVTMPPSNAFEGALLDAYKKQQRHSTEVNGLIDELKSYGQDYKKSY